MNINLSGKNALVCGSTQGIGLAIAKTMAALGANVTLVARNEATLVAEREDLPVTGQQEHRYVCTDFTDTESLKEKLNRYIAEHPPIHILVNNTGGPAGGLAIDAGLEAFANAFQQHLICNQILAQAVVSGMRSGTYGRIINIISTSVKQPLNGLGVSNTIRGAVANWAKTLANELGADGITVNNVLPGATKTQRLASIIKNKAKKSGQDVTAVENAMLSAIPAGRFAEAQEVANAVAFLASPAAAYINGINLPVDGGRTGCL